ncbi:unnamed protein product [Timema podura]|uniref:Death domain-containing protein n=2 Tax=Timema TaxID=61471 RepID=A0ABN7P4S0_TIMPD|nr:unnamed protein product [Timema podura]
MASINRPLNPCHADLRGSASAPPVLDHVVEELVEKTAPIHCGFLWNTQSGLKVCSQICQYVSSTKSSYLYAGWEDMATYLGLNPMHIKAIKYQFNCDPTELTLKVYAQSQAATIDKLVNCFWRMGRQDIIEKSREYLLALASDVLQSNSQREDESGISSLSGGSESSGEESRNIIQPKFLPFVDNVFQKNFSNDQNMLASREISNQSQTNFCQDEFVQWNTPAQEEPKEFDCYVMLTFASDGIKIAQELAQVFRSRVPEQPRIGVVILDEHADMVNTLAGEFIYSCFDQVNFIVPIITQGYVEAISSRRPAVNYVNCVDPKYAKLLYHLMDTEYLHNGCLNYRVRTIIPDPNIREALDHPVMNRPIFQAWEPFSNAKTLAKRLAAHKS